MRLLCTHVNGFLRCHMDGLTRRVDNYALFCRHERLGVWESLILRIRGISPAKRANKLLGMRLQLVGKVVESNFDRQIPWTNLAGRHYLGPQDKLALRFDSLFDDEGMTNPSPFPRRGMCRVTLCRRKLFDKATSLLGTRLCTIEVPV